MTASSLRVGIAGLGRLGRRHATMLAREVARAELVAACSPVADELAWARDGLGVPHVFADYDAMLAHPGLDAVFLVTPTSLHADQIVAALRAGKHVFSEKPTALDLDACRRVEAESKRHPRLKAMIGFVRRFDPHYRDAHAKIQAGAIGRAFFVRSQCADMNDPGGFFVRYAPQSGGIMLDMSVHDIDAARWMLGAGRATRVYATGTIALHPGLAAANDFDNAVAIVEFEGGGIATIQASRTFAHGHESMTEVIGTGGRLSIGANPRLTRVEIADAHGVRNECTPTFYERFEEAFLRELSEFVDVVRADRSPPLTLADATEATRIGIALMESMRARRAIDL
jgi:myo-inositol 2-dehydrogenase/D-chiro-inositol 1-dehydrogenase